jgi:hypothetical protein
MIKPVKLSCAKAGATAGGIAVAAMNKAPKKKKYLNRGKPCDC